MTESESPEGNAAEFLPDVHFLLTSCCKGQVIYWEII